ncbi:MAG: hypothetical protein CMM32_01075 [Rhodospirillaceae bacterium]|nr:hypothetical protein [Rhodospirillaceae bacterium]|tara:strand:- start:257 stop:646 length:390 start_codon:yes stop_codon:yes gene_type:complete
MSVVVISIDEVIIRVQTLDTRTAMSIMAACPIESTAIKWGEEIYFSTLVLVPREEDSKSIVERGEVAYWPEGKAIAIGFGPTPISREGEIRLASPCNIWGHALDDVGALGAGENGDRVVVQLMTLEHGM